MNNLNIFCVTNKPLKNFESSNLKLVGVGKQNFPKSYIIPNNLDNIFYKEEYYSELAFHYWYWKNQLDTSNENWFGFSQRRRHWIKSSSANDNEIDISNISKHLLTSPEEDWVDYEAIICNPIKINNVKKIKILKRGWKSFLKDPSILFDIKKQNLKLHFDMHHGYGNLDVAIEQLESEERKDFLAFVNSKIEFNPHIMYISKNRILDRWFNSLFPWLERCEKVFNINNLNGYDTKRLYAYLAERYCSFWFTKYTKFKEQAWTFIDL